MIDQPAAPTPTPQGGSARAQGQEVVIVVPHTHWDREWHSPFETMRFHLIRFLDELIDALEIDEALPCFLLDGQSVMLEDYLEIRPEQESRLEALVSAGRLRPGPFYVQPDEFLVSGEGLVRNLLLGIRSASRFGPVMREGYLPDTFGHVHQLPQLLRGFGIETFYGMRGFGEDVDEVGSEFWWEAPDGSRVLVHWLVESYSNAAVLASHPETMALNHGGIVHYDSLYELLDRLSARTRTGALLLLNGGDHLRMQDGVSELAASLDRESPTEITLGGLEDFHRLAANAPPPPVVFRGEMRHGRYHDVFECVGSTRTYLKRDNEIAESNLCGLAERLDAIASVTDGRSNAAHLRYAWRELVKNHAHDSICGCSVDSVHDEMRTRFAKVTQVAEAVTGDALHRLAATAAQQGDARDIPVVVVNPSPWARSGEVEVQVVPDVAPPLGKREYGWRQAGDIDWSEYVLVDPGGTAVPFSVRASAPSVEDILQRRKELQRDSITFSAHGVPPLGLATYHLTRATGSAAASSRAATVRDDGHLENQHLRVTVETDGTLTVLEKGTGRTFRGLGELLDDADAGDEYTFCALPDDTPHSGTGAGWRLRHDGAHTITAESSLRLPESLTADRAARTDASTIDCPVTMTVRLPPGSRSVHCHLRLDNRARDHRLRVRFPTGMTTDESLAESAYGTVRRSRILPDSSGWRDRPSGAFALRRFVALESGEDGFALLTRGVHEYGHGEAGELTLTLLRSVGWLSLEELPHRTHKVGPLLETPGAQCAGTQEFDFAIRPYQAGNDLAHLYREAEEMALPIQGYAVQTAAEAPNGLPIAPSFLGVEPGEVVLTALKTAEDGIGVIARVVNTAGAATTAELRFGTSLAGAARTDLGEDDQHPLEVTGHGMVTTRLESGEIATVRVVPVATR